MNLIEGEHNLDVPFYLFTWKLQYNCQNFLSFTKSMAEIIQILVCRYETWLFMRMGVNDNFKFERNHRQMQQDLEELKWKYQQPGGNFQRCEMDAYG